MSATPRDGRVYGQVLRDAQTRLREDGEVRFNSPLEVMRFTLVYRGPLVSQGKESRTDEKHDIRKQLHPQLAELWKSKRVLNSQMGKWVEHMNAGLAAGKSEAEANQEWREMRLTIGGSRKTWLHCAECGEFRFIPLVTEKFGLVCELDILFLRAELPGNIFAINSAGDLDNRLKVLFDALRMPRAGGELPKLATPDAGERPFFCLLENDNLITAVRIESERLLDITPETRNRVELIIRVTVKASYVNMLNVDIVAMS